MANFEATPVNAGTSAGFSFTSQAQVAAPFTESNMTWVEAENSTAADWAGFYITFMGVASGSKSGIFFVAKGAAASEVRVATIPAGLDTKNLSCMFYIPVPIPAGTRLSVSASQSAAAVLSGQIVGVLSANFDAEPTYTVFESGPYDLSASLTYGLFPAIDPGATTNTKGAYSEVSFTGHASNIINGDSLDNTYDYFGLIISNNYNTANDSKELLLDLATGVAASEVIWAADLNARQNQNEVTQFTTPMMVPTTAMTSTTRISARAQSNDNDATDRIRGVLLFGVR